MSNPTFKPLPWFPRFLAEHLALHPEAGLVAADSPHGGETYRMWEKLLGEIEGIDYAACSAASRRLLVEPATRSRWFTTLREFAVEEIKGRSPAKPLPTHGTREEAEAASKFCERCGGQGFVQVWNPDTEHRLKYVMAHCVCSLGRWIRARNAVDKEGQLINRRTPDLDAVIKRVSPWLPYDPRSVDITDPRSKPF